jgi:hypothetical protein
MRSFAELITARHQALAAHPETNPLDTDGNYWAWSATLLETFKACPRLFYYSFVVGIRPAGLSVHLTFGDIYHAALELYDRERSAGRDHEDATVHAVAFAMRESWDWQSENPAKNRETCIRSIIWYLDEFADDPLETVQLADGSPAVELSFRLELSERFVLAGHLDRVVQYQGDSYVSDRKTTSSALSAFYFSRYEPDTQMSLYTAASRIIYKAPVKGVIIDAAQVGVTYTRFARSFTFRGDEQLDEFLVSAKWWINQVPAAKAAGWPMNEASCSRYGGCAFRSICSRVPRVRESMLLGPEWEAGTYNPLEVRGE